MDSFSSKIMKQNLNRLIREGIVTCEAAGSLHQNMRDVFPNSRNASCVTSGACAIAAMFKDYLSDVTFTSDVVDQIVRNGYCFWERCVEDGLTDRSGHIFPGDLPQTFFFNDIEFFIGGRDTDSAYGQFPIRDTETDIEASLSHLESLLLEGFNADLDGSGFLFTGQGYTVSFWKNMDKFYLFNSHGVNSINVVDFADERKNVARLFSSYTHEGLALLLFANAACDGVLRAYQICKLTLMLLLPILSPHNENDSEQGLANNSGHEMFDGDGNMDFEAFYGSNVSPPGSPSGLDETNDFSLEGSSLVVPASPVSTCILDGAGESSGLPTVGASFAGPCRSVSSLSSSSSEGEPLAVILASKRKRIEKASVKPKSAAASQKPSAAPNRSAPGEERTAVVSCGSDADIIIEQRVVVSKTGGRPKKRKRGRPKTSSLTLEEQKKATQKKNYDKNKSKKIEASKRYQKEHSEAHQAAVEAYTERNPQVNRDAVQAYTERNPQVNRDAVQAYTERNPQVNRDAVQAYRERNPQVNRDAVQAYRERNPQVNRDAVQRFAETYPDAQATYDAVRHLPRAMRIGPLVGTWRGDQLNAVEPYFLKQQDLNLGPKCLDCDARFFEEETGRRQWCCQSGRLCFLKLPPLPADAQFYDHPRFRECPGTYNNLFAMCASCLTGEWLHTQLGPGPAYVKIQGRTYHLLFDGDRAGTRGRPNYTQFFFDDGAQRRREAEGQHLNEVVINAIQTVLRANNPYYHCFKRLADEPSASVSLVFQHVERKMGTHNFIDGDPNAEVAVIMPTEEVPYEKRKLFVSKHGVGSHFIDYNSPHVEPMSYPLLFPSGDQGWSFDLKSENGKKVTVLQYVRYRLLAEPRFSEFSRLSDTWLVDSYCRVEEEKLRYLEYCQRNPDCNEQRIAPREELQAVVDAQEVAQARGGNDNGQGTPRRGGRGRGLVIGRGGRRGHGRAGAASGVEGRPARGSRGFSGIYEDVMVDETVQGEGIQAGRVYLPNTFVGSKRYYKKHYLDSMAVVSRRGAPHYFLTMTNCGSWPEYRKSRRGRTTEAHLSNRVFKLKVARLLKDIKSGRFFGRLDYFIYVVEFQARGLAHIHLCFRVADANAPLQAADVDRFIRADIPSECEANGRLREMILKHNIHGPCGPPNRTSLPCWDSEKHSCKKYFPKAATPYTYLDQRGFYHFKRNPNNTAIIPVNGRNVVISDLDVVSYNAALTLIYDCHCNVDIASGRRSFKYLFKYLYKGAPLTRVRLVGEVEPDEGPVNECQEYRTSRILGATDAAWRILEFPMVERHPTVQVLPVHMAERQTVRYRLGQEREALEHMDGDLEFYFKRPLIEELDNVTYIQFHERYIVHSRRPTTRRVPVWDCVGDPVTHFVTRRQKGEKICRLFWQAPNRGELFYLRLLLMRFPCRGYADLLALGGPECTTFQEAARLQGLLDDEKEYSESLVEAHSFMLGYRLRQFFVMLCVVGAPAVYLWEQHKDLLSEDLFEGEENRERAYHVALIQIDRALRRHGKRLVDFGLPAVEDNTTELGRERVAYDRTACSNFVTEWLPLLSNEQRSVFDYVCALVEPPDRVARSNGVFLDAPGGSGKSLLGKVIAAHLRSRGRIVLCVASSGIAASVYVSGMTAHSMFSFPLELLDSRGSWGLTNGCQRARLIEAADLIIFDEISMSHRYYVEMLDRGLRDLCKQNRLFGGKAVMLCGDFRQLAPIVRGAETPDVVIAASLKVSPLWPALHKMALTVAQRCTDPLFSQFLLDVGNGTAPKHVLPECGSDEQLIALHGVRTVPDVSSLIESVFPDEIVIDPDECAFRAVLAPHLVNVTQVNNTIADKINSQDHYLYSADALHGESAESGEVVIDVETLNEATDNGVPPHKLRLKVGAVCVLMRNLNFEESLLNGTKVIVEEVRTRVVIVRRPNSQVRYAIPRIIFILPIHARSEIKMQRRQFPLQLAYALSVHKSQSQTIKRCGVDLRSFCFTHGQLYVALSRVCSPDDIVVLVPGAYIKDGVAYTRNVVYSPLLGD